MSFFDDADDEPSRTEIRRPSRPSPRRPNSGGSGSGGRRRPPSRGADHQSILIRRGVAAVVLIVIIVLIAVGVSSCQSSARKSALQDYANSVNSLISRSQQTSKSLFTAIQGASGSTTSASQSINNTEQAAQNIYQDAEKLNAPSAVRTANAHLLYALQLRLDGITNIAHEIQPALGKSITQSAVKEIAASMAYFYASDVTYKNYVAPGVVSALHADKLAVGGSSGVPINSAQFLPSLDWLRPAYLDAVLGASGSRSGSSGSGSSGTVTGLHGDSLNSVTVAGTALVAGGTNTITASPAPTFTLSVTNGGNFNETDVVCKVTVTGANVTGTKVIGEIDKGATTTCDVTLSSAPPKGQYNIVATVEKVPGEKNLDNNTLSYPITFN